MKAAITTIMILLAESAFASTRNMYQYLSHTQHNTPLGADDLMALESSDAIQASCSDSDDAPHRFVEQNISVDECLTMSIKISNHLSLR